MKANLEELESTEQEISLGHHLEISPEFIWEIDDELLEVDTLRVNDPLNGMYTWMDESYKVEPGTPLINAGHWEKI